MNEKELSELIQRARKYVASKEGGEAIDAARKRAQEAAAQLEKHRKIPTGALQRTITI